MGQVKEPTLAREIDEWSFHNIKDINLRNKEIIISRVCINCRQKLRKSERINFTEIGIEDVIWWHSHRCVARLLKDRI